MSQQSDDPAIDFPLWAPADLVEEYRAPSYMILDDGIDDSLLWIDKKWMTGKQRQHLLCQMISAPDMEAVWRSLSKRKEAFHNSTKSERLPKTPSIDLFQYCMKCAENWQRLPKRTPAASREIYNKIAKSTLELALLLIECDDDDLRSQWGIEAVDEGDIADAVKRFRSMIETDERHCDFALEMTLRCALPGVDKVLMNMREHALWHAQYPAGVHRPNSPTAVARYFVRYLSKYFTEHYGQPLHEQVRRITNTLLSSDLTDEDVRSQVAAEKRAHKTFVKRRMAETLSEKERGE